MRISTHLVELQMSRICILHWQYDLSGISNIIYSHTTYYYIPNKFFYTTYLSYYYHLFKDHTVTLLLFLVPHDSNRLDAPIPTKPQRITWCFALLRLLTVPHLNIKWMTTGSWQKKKQTQTVTYLKPSVRFSLGRPWHDPSKMGFHLMVREEIILHGPFPSGTSVVVFFVCFRPLLIIIHLPNQ